MVNFFARQGAAFINEMNRSLGALLGIVTGVLSDRELVDAEIRFLNDWLEANSAIASSWCQRQLNTDTVFPASAIEY